MTAKATEIPKGGLGAALGIGAIVSAVSALAGLIGGGIVALALLGTPLFAIMGGASELAWLLHPDPTQRHLDRIAANVLTEHFAGSPILVTIPLFTFVGYVLAESKTAERLVGASTALFGWMPGGLAIVCVVASAIFTLFTGGSGVTIIAIGGLLYPALRKEGYSEKFSLGVVTSGGSLGLLLPYSLPLIIYCLVANVDFVIAFKAVIAPGILVLLMFAAYAVFVGIKEKIPRSKFEIAKVGRALWELKWELGVPVILIGGIKTGLQIDECAGVVALYVVLIEVFLYKDITFKKDIPQIAKSAMSLAGAVILILSMANALINYVVNEDIPGKVMAFMTAQGVDTPAEFLIAMNIFLLVLGMLMEGFSAILVAVPLILPFAARFHLGPFHTAMIFLLNLELAYCAPPLGLNLFIASFRFNRSAVSLYRPIMPFVGVLLAALLIISYVPQISNVMILGDIAAARAKAAKLKAPPTDAWKLECVQGDPNDPQPCTEEECKQYNEASVCLCRFEPADKSCKSLSDKTPAVSTATPAVPDAGTDAMSSEDQRLFNEMMGVGADAGSGADSGLSADEKLYNEMMNAGKDSGAATPAPKPLTEDEKLFNEMMGAGKDGGH